MAHRKNHVASRFYLARWAGQCGRLCAVTPPTLESFERKPDKVGWRPRYWSKDPVLCAKVENAINPIEREAANALNLLCRDWPHEGSSKVRREAAKLMALHLLRSPFAMEYTQRQQRDVLNRNLPCIEKTLTGPAMDTFLRQITSDQWRTDYFLEQIPKTAGALASMHWTLVVFDQPVLATSDQPLTAVPFMAPGTASPLQPVPTTGLLDAQEFRFPVDPFCMLLLTWRDGPDSKVPVKGTNWIEAQMNRATIGQADSEWFHHPERRPITLVPPILEIAGSEPIGGNLLSGYNVDEALNSARRSRVIAIIHDLIEQGDHNKMVVLKLDPSMAHGLV